MVCRFGVFTRWLHLDDPAPVLITAATMPRTRHPSTRCGYCTSDRPRRGRPRASSPRPCCLRLPGGDGDRGVSVAGAGDRARAEPNGGRRRPRTMNVPRRWITVLILAALLIGALVVGVAILAGDPRTSRIVDCAQGYHNRSGEDSECVRDGGSPSRDGARGTRGAPSAGLTGARAGWSGTSCLHRRDAGLRHPRRQLLQSRAVKIRVKGA
jgi:hypothetical protein